MSALNSLEESACEAARLAGEVLRRRFRTEVASRIETKGLHDYVTAVDREAEAVILEFLGTRYPDHAFMSEENHPISSLFTYKEVKINFLRQPWVGCWVSTSSHVIKTVRITPPYL